MDQKHIQFLDLYLQPKPMKNGLPIYNIKAIYRNEYAFELQIKSKIYSAWTDMDHSLFYKDYSITPIRDAVQIAMNRIGKLLSQIEKFLYDLRLSHEDYSKKAELFDQLKRFDNEFGGPLKEKLNSEFNIVNIAPILIFFLEQFENSSSPIDTLDFGHLNLTPSSGSNIQYVKIRDEDFELIILETIYFNWKMKYEGIAINEENYDELITNYLSILITRISSLVNISEKPIEEDMMKNYLKEKIIFLLNYSLSSKILLSADTYINIYRINSLLVDHLEDLCNSSNDYKDIIVKLYSIEIFNADFQKYLELLKSLTEISIDEISRLLIEIHKEYSLYEDEYGIQDLGKYTQNLLEKFNKSKEV